MNNRIKFIKGNEFIIEFLNWDSNFFDLKIGKFEINRNLEINELKKIKNLIFKSKFNLIYIYTNIKYTPLRFLYEIGSKLIDTQLNLKMQIPLNIKKMECCFVDQNNFQKYTNLKEFYRISDQIAPISRFSYDSKIELKKVLSLYRLMVDNSLNKTYGDGLIIDTGEDKILKGFISLKTIDNLGRELLIGVDRLTRGRGIATELFKQFLWYCYSKSIKEIKTVVSIKNIEGINFHLGLGYKIEKINNIFHLWVRV